MWPGLKKTETWPYIFTNIIKKKENKTDKQILVNRWTERKKLKRGNINRTMYFMFKILFFDSNKAQNYISILNLKLQTLNTYLNLN